MMRCLLVISLTLTASLAFGQTPVVDGTLDVSYGSALQLQTVQTQFGNEDGLDDPNGGELDGAYLAIEGDRLYIAITGNLETDSFNKLSLFIDSKAGGENVLSATPDYDFGSVSSNLGLISFATGFDADYHLFARAGGGNFEVDFVDRAGGGSSMVPSNTGSAGLSGDYGTAAGSVTAASLGGNASGAAIGMPIEFALDNSNTAGVGEGTDAPVLPAEDPAAVTTGAEFSIALSDLGAGPGDTISIVAGYSNGDYNFWSNQFLGGLAAPQGNLGADGMGNFVNPADTTPLDLSALMPFSIVVPIPEPSSAALLWTICLGGFSLLRNRS